MPKIKKHHKKKVYRYNVNRKRLRNKIYSSGKISCKEIKQAWESRKSIKGNLQEMGLSYDPNITIGIPKFKQELKKKLLENESNTDNAEDTSAPKKYVAEKLETEARAPREKLLRLPKSQVEWITYLLDKYRTDYKAMAKDSRNHNQETWKQLRAKIKMFQKIPQQYNQYLKDRGLSDDHFQEGDVEEDDW